MQKAMPLAKTEEQFNYGFTLALGKQFSEAFIIWRIAHEKDNQNDNAILAMAMGFYLKRPKGRRHQMG
jgi:hypothetical protein